jgi:hypothetical protein
MANMSNTDQQKVEEMAKELFIRAIAKGEQLGRISALERQEMFIQVKKICYEAALVFYGFKIKE